LTHFPGSVPTSLRELERGKGGKPSKVRTAVVPNRKKSALQAEVREHTGGEIAEQVRSAQMSADGFRCMGLTIFRGRAYAGTEDLPNGPRVTLISQGFWTRRFAGDPQILGKTISLGGEPYTVIGIVADNPALLEFGPASDVYLPFPFDPNTTDQGHYFQVFARLKPGVSLKQAQARLQASAAEYRAKFPAAIGPKNGFTVTPYTVNTAGLPRLGQDGVAVTVDWRLLLFALTVSLATGIVFGLFPSLQAARADLNSVLKDSSGRSGTGFRQNKTRAVLVVVEMSLAVILLVGSALLMRTFFALYAVNPGFDTKNVVTMKMSFTGPQFEKTSVVAQIVRIGLERLQALPGVKVATASCCLPLQGGYGLPFNVIGRAPADGPFTGGGGFAPVSAGYFEAFKIPIKRGRSFTDRDDGHAPAVAIISESMAKQFWKDGDPLKDRILIGGGAKNMKELRDEPVRQIIGIAGDVRDGGLNNDPGPKMYVPQSQVPDALSALGFTIYPLAWVVRTAGNPATLVPAIQEELRRATGLPVSDLHSMDEIVALSTARQRFNMLLMSVFGGAALLLAAIGIYGLMAYSVEQRTQEIGIRLALGAEENRVRNMVVRQGMGLALAGVLTGIAAAFGLARFLESLLFGVKARDPIIFVSVPAMLMVVALLAVWVPAVRASKVNPVDSLRYE
jgi:putative ABC transport system permease protein